MERKRKNITTISDMEKKDIKWITLDNADGTATLKQHAFIPKEFHQKYTGEEYIGNISLCGKIYAFDSDENVEEWGLLVGEQRKSSSCKACIKIQESIQNYKYLTP